MSRSCVVRVQGLRKGFEGGLEILKGVDLEVLEGEIVAVLGSSGSGKSTLLQIIGGLESFDSGTVEIAGRSIERMNEAELSKLRNESLGFIYQFHHLLPEFSALENAAMPLLIARLPEAEACAKAAELLTKVGLGERLEHLPGMLSGGERQRVAIARAAASGPKCILADEPTGNLDSESASEAFNLFLKLARNEGTAVIMVTHDKELASRCDRVLVLKAGRLLEE